MADQPTTTELIGRAQALMASGQWEQAEAVCQQVIRAAPEQSQAWLFIGLARLSRRAVAEAEAAFRRAIELDDRPILAWNMLSAALREQARWEEAANASRQSLTRDPGDAVAWGNLATAELML